MMIPYSCIIIYLIAGILAGLQYFQERKRLFPIVQIAGIVGILLHAWILHQMIDTALGQNLSFINVMSQVVWLIALILWFTNFAKIFESLMMAVYPFAAITILLMFKLPSYNIIQINNQPVTFIHIILAIFVFSIFFIAATQAILLGLQNYLLRKHQTAGFLKKLPPLETMESLLAQLLSIGFFLLTVILLTSLFFYKNIFAPNLIQHTIFSVLAWLVFAVLLIGRYWYGWRLSSTIRWTLIGVLFLSVSYWLILEFF